jgi:hypothetical protein
MGLRESVPGERVVATRPESSRRAAVEGRADGSFVVPGLSRTITAKRASKRGEFERAFALLAARYQARGYDEPSGKPFRFTPHHALPGTLTFVAKDGERVVATLSMVPDSPLLRLPMESIYGEEIARLRREGRRLAEVTSLASDGLGPREFLRVFAALIKLAIQTHLRRGGDSWVITINPRHRAFYRRAMGFVPIGPRRPHPSVRAHPAEAYLLDAELIAARAPDGHRDFFVEELPEAVLSIAGRPADHALFFAERSTSADLATIEALLRRAESSPCPSPNSGGSSVAALSPAVMSMP